MSGIFKNHLDKFITISPGEFTDVCGYFEPMQVRKKENLLTAGEVCKHHYFVLKGCLRKFFINEKGVEQTTEFAIENWWLTDNIAYEKQLPSAFFIQAVEPAELLCINY
ncbi:Crp/Fnr family transcriptional regulator [Adhaeribacter rhizoryzae]|uniref:Crp/Fnr family transcriptional regulator n=1 Tax=Adhaeribacter rhizoryzae TaxID=2607907 RepID=UPI001CC1F76E|nr:cyclic nucleotide-binding domain-containing protein [Adhaeribacter rhizoryzae]